MSVGTLSGGFKYVSIGSVLEEVVDKRQKHFQVGKMY